MPFPPLPPGIIGAAGRAVPAIRPGGDLGRTTNAIGVTRMAGREGAPGGAMQAGLRRAGS